MGEVAGTHLLQQIGDTLETREQLGEKSVSSLSYSFLLPCGRVCSSNRHRTSSPSRSWVVKAEGPWPTCQAEGHPCIRHPVPLGGAAVPCSQHPLHLWGAMLPSIAATAARSCCSAVVFTAPCVLLGLPMFCEKCPSIAQGSNAFLCPVPQKWQLKCVYAYVKLFSPFQGIWAVVFSMKQVQLCSGFSLPLLHAGMDTAWVPPFLTHRSQTSSQISISSENGRQNNLRDCFISELHLCKSRAILGESTWTSISKFALSLHTECLS